MVARKTAGEQIKAGIERARMFGRRPGPREKVSDAEILAAIPFGTTEGAERVGLSKSRFMVRRRAIEEALLREQAHNRQEQTDD